MLGEIKFISDKVEKIRTDNQAFKSRGYTNPACVENFNCCIWIASQLTHVTQEISIKRG